MPLPESSQSKMVNCSSEPTFMHDEFAELLWDNGPVMQGQSNRPRKSSNFTALPLCGGRVSEKDGKDNPYPKIGHFRAAESKLNSFPGFGINAHDDDDIGPWINYPMEDPLPNDYCSEFLNGYSGVNVNSIQSQTIAVPAIRSSFLEQVGRDSRNVEQGHAMEASRIRPDQPCQLPTQFHSSVTSAKSSEMELGIGNSSKALREGGGNGLMNFSHFSRPVALTRANLQAVDRSAGNKSKENFAISSSNPMKTTVIESTSGLRSVLGAQDQLCSVPPNRDLIPSPKRPQEVIFIDKTLCEGENSSKNSNPNPTNTCNVSPARIQSSSFAASAALGRHETVKGNEAAVASPSGCSGSSSGPVSNDHKQRRKRKHEDGEESGYQSEDLEEESMELKKSSTAQGKSKKRSRAAEVHNLSERRRRDRINERMRALQELVPNCNKSDKASMLDEAIEYLKSLQMQVQMMSMGSGPCMPPVMMQHMQAPTTAHFSPMGIGMGMGIGLSYGMGMYDMNGSPGCSFVPVSPIHGPHFPCPSIPGPQGLHRVPGSNSLQMFGIPGQGLPVPMPPRPPPASLTDTKISTVAATKSENHLQSKGLTKTEIKY